mgnify:CR=1 FL=1
MTFEEKLKRIKRSDEETYLLISPRVIEPAGSLVDNDETLELYSHIEDNTKEFAAQIMNKLVNNANFYEREDNTTIDLGLIFCGDFNNIFDYLNSPGDFIINNKEKIIAIYAYPILDRESDYLDEYYLEEEIQGFGYIYISLEELLSILDKNNFKYMIDVDAKRDLDKIGNNKLLTSFVISYTPDKKIEKENGLKLTRKREK